MTGAASSSSSPLLEGRLATGCWYRRPDLHGVPVAASRGLPRNVPYAIERAVQFLLAPSGRLLTDRVLDEVAWARAYRAEMHPRRAVIEWELVALAAAYDGRLLVMCCFEPDPVDCHRAELARLLVRWGFAGAVPEVTSGGAVAAARTMSGDARSAEPGGVVQEQPAPSQDEAPQQLELLGAVDDDPRRPPT